MDMAKTDSKVTEVLGLDRVHTVLHSLHDYPQGRIAFSCIVFTIGPNLF